MPVKIMTVIYKGVADMNITVILIEAAVFAVLFTVLVFASYGGNGKYSASAIHDYPPDIQE